MDLVCILDRRFFVIRLIAKIEKIAASDKASAELKAAVAKFIETKESTKENTAAADALVAELEKAAAAGC